MKGREKVQTGEGRAKQVLLEGMGLGLVPDDKSLVLEETSQSMFIEPSPESFGLSEDHGETKESLFDLAKAAELPQGFRL